MGWVLALLLAAGCADNPAGSTEVARVDVTPAARTLRVGDTLRIAATPRAADGSALPAAVEWRSGDERVAEVDAAGRVVARAAGTAVIRARSGGRTGEATLSVHPALAVAAVEITGPRTVIAGEAQQLGAIARAGDGTVLAGRAVEWTSSDTAVARVTEAGLVLGRRAGLAVIGARVEGHSAQLSLRVEPAVASLVLDPYPGPMAPGEGGSLSATVRGHDGVVLTPPIAWASDNDAVVTVSRRGHLVAHAPGTARITATVGGVSAHTIVHVAPWTERALTGVPILLLARTVTGGDGAARAERWEVHGGTLRTIASPAGNRFEIHLDARFFRDGVPAPPAVNTVRGEYTRAAGSAAVGFLPETGEGFGGEVRADGGWVVTRRFAPAPEPTILRFAPP